MTIFRNPKLNYGFIYILSNESMPNVYKIGMTTNTVRQRIQELNTTGIPKSFKPEKIFEIPENFLRSVERQAHRKLKQKKFHHGKEFFKCSLQDCVLAVEDTIFEIVSTESYELIGEAKQRKEHEVAKKKAEKTRLEEERKVRSEIQEQLNEFNKIIDLRRQKYIRELKTKKNLHTPALEKYFYVPLLCIGLIFLGIAMMFIFGPISWIGIPLIAWWYWKESDDKEKEGYKIEAGKKYPYVTYETITPEQFRELNYEVELTATNKKSSMKNLNSNKPKENKISELVNIKENEQYDPNTLKVTCPTCKITQRHYFGTNGYKCSKCESVFLY